MLRFWLVLWVLSFANGHKLKQQYMSMGSTNRSAQPDLPDLKQSQFSFASRLPGGEAAEHGASRDVTRRRLTAASSKCKKLLWFTAVGGTGGHVSHYRKFLRVAMMSHLESAPSLVPHLIYDSVNDTITDWYKSKGGTVHFHRLSFYAKLEDAVKKKQHEPSWLTNTGAYLRLDIPLLMPNIKLDPQEVETEFVLYTDTDVVFMKDIDSCSVQKPAVMAVGPEWTKGLRVNSGVLFINLQTLARDRKLLEDWGVQHGWPGLYDQTIITSVYGNRLQLLPDTFNWKPYWGRTDNIVIVHLHGPKPERCLDCLVLSSIDRQPITKCGCPSIYAWLWNMAPDKGRFYEDVLLKYYMYLLRSLEVTEGSKARKSRAGKGEGGAKRKARKPPRL